jgi:hypothetical protein
MNDAQPFHRADRHLQTSVCRSMPNVKIPWFEAGDLRMGSLILFLVTVAVAYIVDAVLVGAFLYVLRSRFSLNLSKISAPLTLLIIFAFLDLFWIPAIVVLDGRIRILNHTIATTLGLSGETTFVELFSVGWFDLLVWAMQVLVAVWVADKLGERRLVTRPTHCLEGRTQKPSMNRSPYFDRHSAFTFRPKGKVLPSVNFTCPSSMISPKVF